MIDKRIHGISKGESSMLEVVDTVDVIVAFVGTIVVSVIISTVSLQRVSLYRGLEKCTRSTIENCTFISRLIICSLTAFSNCTCTISLLNIVFLGLNI